VKTQRNTINDSVRSPFTHIYEGDNVNANDDDDDSVITPLHIDNQSSSDSDDNDHHSRSRSRRHNKTHRTRTSAKILSEMMKQDKTVKLLTFHKEPDRRLSAFMIFRDEMQTICKLTPELERSFRHILQIRKPRTVPANDALYTFIITHCDRNTRETLVNFAADHRTTFQSGILAFKHLERMFAPSDINATQKATTEYMTIFPKMKRQYPISIIVSIINFESLLFVVMLPMHQLLSIIIY
jgi:hypothetical protein